MHGSAGDNVLHWFNHGVCREYWNIVVFFSLVTGSLDETLHVWNTDTGELIHVLNGHSDAIHAVLLGGVRAFSGDDDGTIKVSCVLPGVAFML